MKKLLTLLSLILLAGCGIFQSTQSASCPPPQVETKIDTVYTPGKDLIDTVTITITKTFPSYVWRDTGILVTVDTVDMIGAMVVYPNVTTGDSYPQMQAAASYQCTHPGTRIFTVPGTYAFSHSILWANFNGTDFSQVKMDIEGPVDARNTPASTVFQFNNVTDFGIGVQNCKGCTIKNINIIGSYYFPSQLDMLQVDTLSFNSWPDTANGGSRTSPYAAIVIDPFSDPSYWASAGRTCIGCKFYPSYIPYYVPGMSLGASTSIAIDQVQATQWVVGVMVTPSMQSNGEMIRLTNSQIYNCKVAYAYSQAQSKENTIDNFMCWGNTRYVVDGNDYGFQRGDGSTCPVCSHFNVAGWTYGLFNINCPSFSANWDNIYAETVFKLGYISNNYMGFHGSNFQVDFQGDYPGAPTPDYLIGGGWSSFTNCAFRIYNDNGNTRMIFNQAGNVFRDCTFGTMPIALTNKAADPSDPLFFECRNYYYYGVQQRYVPGKGGADSLYYLGGQSVHVDRENMVGWFLSPSASVCKVDYTISSAQAYVDPAFDGSNIVAVGRVARVGGDTVFLKNTGLGIADGYTADLFQIQQKVVQ